MNSIAFFNHKGGVGKTTMLFNIAIEMGRLGKRMLLVDFDAQANLTAIALNDKKLEELYAPGAEGHDGRSCVRTAGEWGRRRFNPRND